MTSVNTDTEATQKPNNSRKINSDIFQTAKYRADLPQLADKFFLTDGGIETWLIFHKGWELPLFMSFPLLDDEKGIRHLREYFQPFLELAVNSEVGFILESPTWRASSGWGRQIGYTEEKLKKANQKAIALLARLRDEYETEKSEMVISGNIGPRGDGYTPTNLMTAEEAEKYHSAQIRTFSETAADLVTALTINYVEEAIGITRVAKSANMPVVISFTVETDGKLPTGQMLKEAIGTVDEATNYYPAYFMVNCAHPTHFETVLAADEFWTERIRGIRSNASAKSHAEIDESTELDEGNPGELGQHYRGILSKLKNIKVLGGCCGTDFRHINEIAKTCLNLKTIE